MLSAAALVTIEEAQQYVGVDDAQTPDLERYIEAASAWWSNATAPYLFQEATVTDEIRNGDDFWISADCYGARVITPLYHPVVSVTSLSFRYGNTWTAQTLTGANAPIVDGLGISFYLPTLIIPRGQFNVKLTYEAGLADVPEQVKQAVLELVKDKWTKSDRQAQGIASVSEPGGRTVTYRDYAIPPSVLDEASNWSDQIPGRGTNGR